MDLAFEVAARFRPFSLIASHAVAVDLHRPVAGTSPDVGPVAPYAAVELGLAGATGRTWAGLAGPDGTAVLAVHDPARRRVQVEVRVAGRTRVVRRRRAALPAAHRLAFVLCESQVTVVADTGEGWVPLLTERDRVAALLDLTDPAVLGGLRYTWGTDAGVVDRVRAGVFGMTGLRDLHLVQHADGRPVVRDGRVFLTATCAGMGFFRQAHWGVVALDPADPTRLEHVATLFSRRDGRVLGDHAGQLVRDGDRWLVATSSWGDFDARRGGDGTGVHVRHAESDADLLTGVHVLDTERAALPTAQSCWDPAMTRVDGRWHVAFVESPSQRPFAFHPALAVADGPGWLDGLRLVGAATDLRQCEGPVLVTVGGRTRLLASDGDARRYPVFDLGMHPVGRLDAPYPSNIPHPQLVPLADGGHLLVTFDGTGYGGRVLGYGGHGDVVVMRSRA